MPSSNEDRKKQRSSREKVSNCVTRLANTITWQEASKPTRFKPGSLEKIIIMNARYEHGLPLHLE